MSGLAAGVAQGAGLVLAPAASGLIQTLKARLQGRRGPSPLQPYRDLRRLWGKSVVRPEGTSALYELAPALAAASLTVALAVVPVAGRAAGLGVGNDAILVVGLLALGRFAVTLAAWDTGSGFALMGAGRDLTFAVFIEPVLLLALLLAALAAGGTTDLVSMSADAAGSDIWKQPAHWCAAAAFALVLIAESGRQPVDNPDTHLELTMVHEGPLLEYAGRDLALLQWGAAARLWLLAMLAIDLFAPMPADAGAALGVAAAHVLILCAAIAMTETALAKMRVLRVPLFLGGGAALCLLGFAATLVGGGS